MMLKIRGGITQEDIDAGVRRRCRSCPFAHAAGRSLGRPVIVDMYLWTGDSEEIICGLPGAVVDFITRYDDDRPVEPITFVLDVSDAHRQYAPKQYRVEA